ncbi:hypothetical protein FSP39_022407 [Pinctada imbricata]|uniref:protein-tyrosine-phosphatase n=1 Tax=Pinctada imbricata TaxID=66713 RepID=A0AA88YBC4_PINIB|nr:hypothetical protein FSP39_022407 [Pinctada imbricata]
MASGAIYLDHMISGLQPGQTYAVLVDRDGLLIDNTTITMRPLPPFNLSISEAGTNFLQITWSLEPSSKQDKIRIKISSNDSDVTEVDIPSGEITYNITDLLPGRDYTVTMAAVSRGVYSNTSMSLIDNTVPTPPSIHLISALDNRSLLITTLSDQFSDKLIYTATYNDTSGVEKVLELVCHVILHSCVTEVHTGRPGIDLEIQVYAVKGSRRSLPDMVLHSTKPNPVEGIREDSGSTNHLHLSLTPPINSNYSSYIIRVSEDDGSGDYISERNLTLPGTETDFFLWNLTAGYTYNVSVSATTEWEESDPFYMAFNTAPNSVESMTLEEITNSSVTVTWSSVKSGGLDSYHVSINPKEQFTMSPLVQFNLTDRRETFSDLIPGKFYTISVMAYKGKKISPPQTKAFWTKPNPPINLNITVKSGREIDADWAPPPEGMVDNYTLFITSQNTTDADFDTLVFVLTETYYRFTTLHPGETYNISVRANSGDAYSELVSTPLQLTSSVAELFVDFIDFDMINVTWPKPNGSVFDSYQLNIDPSDKNSSIIIPESSGIVHYSFSDLKPGRRYTVSLAIIDSGVKTDETSISVITTPRAVYDLNVTSHDPMTLNLEWRVDDPEQQHHFLVQYHDVDASGNLSLPMILALHDVTVYSAHILNLEPGHRYTVYVQAKQEIETMVAYSPWVTTNKTTMPLQVVDLKYQLMDFDVQLSWQPNTSSTQNSYFIWYRSTMPGFSGTWKQNSTKDLTFTLKDLFPGLQYEMVVFAVSYEESSLPTMKSTQIPPLPPSNLTVADVNTTSFTLSWVYDEQSTYVEEWVVLYEGLVDNVNSNETIVALSGQRDQSVTISGLTAGLMYDVTIYSLVKDVKSKIIHRHVTVKPVCKVSLTLGQDTTNSITVFYSQESNYFDYYKFWLVNGSKEIMKNKTDPLRQVEFNQLSGGTEYIVYVVAVSGDQESDPIMLPAQTLPNNPRVDRISLKTSIRLKIHRPEGGVDSYMAVCTPNCGSHTAQANQDVVSILFEGLLPYTSYQFQITTIAGSKTSDLFLNIQTSQSAPGAVGNLRAVEPSALTANVTWTPPSTTNGQITAYIVQYYRYAEDGQVTDSGSQNKTAGPLMSPQSVIFSNLKAGYKYIFMVYAKTVEIGEVATVQLQLRTYHPPLKDGITITDAQPRKLDKGENLLTPNTMKVYFTNAFSDKYGKIVQYTVIVATDTDDLYFKSHTLPDWKSAQNDRSIKAYQTIANCSDFFHPHSTCTPLGPFTSDPEANHRVFEIGADANCASGHYCNGPLQPQTKYYVKLRAYTTGGYSDTVYSDPIITAAIPPEPESTSVGMIVGIILAVLAVPFIIAVIIFIKRRRDNKGNMARSTGIGSNFTPRSSMRVIKKSHLVQIGDFKEYIKTLSADSDFKYAEHFEELKEVGRDQSSHAAELPVNRGKNRFTNILPYDHSRVKLLPTDDEEGSDYINANYVPGYSSKREYIVTQGPLPSTRDDFWRMVWEQNIRNIVMLTRCVEKGREKCDHYWPMGSDAMFYGDLQVAALNETKFPTWSVTEFRVAYGNLTRQVRHFHFTAWPDFGVPERPATLVRFVKTVREQLIKECGPILVHCSAGVGRSGTFIVLDRLLQHIKDHDTVDVFAVVHELRKERMWMVQTEQQYICIHQCLLCVLEGREEEHVYHNVGVSNNAFEVMKSCFSLHKEVLFPRAVLPIEQMDTLGRDLEYFIPANFHNFSSMKLAIDHYRAQATKRKVEQEKEEKRRQLILSKRREQQREATEKYQRSHLPARPPSGRSSSSSHRAHSRSGRGLDETLRLIRGHSAHSGHHRHRNGGQGQSPRQTYNDALNKPYFNKYSSHRPNSPPEKCDSQAKNRLHNNSLRNLTNSKSLFEQQLEQQQRMLADQQKQAIHDFNNAVMQEMSEDNHGYGYNNYDNHDQCDSDSLSSVDSLERSQNQDSHYGNGYTHGNTGEIQPMEHMVSNSNVIRTSSSGVLTRDTHQNVRDVSAQLNSNFANMYSPMNPSDMTSQIDSYNVDQTQNISQKNMSRAEMKPDFQSAYQGVNKGNDNRPKVQLRAWATPSPVDGAHSSKAPVIPMTNTNPYTPRNTMTTVTMTTTYDENKSKNLQNNDRLEERPNPLNVYSNRLASHVIPNGYNVIDSNVGDNVQEREVQRNGTRNLEFLETVTNTLDKKVQSQGIVNVTMPVSQGTVPVSQGAMPVSQGAMPVSQGALPVSQGALPFSQGTVPVSQGAMPVTQGALNNIDNRDNNSLSKPLPSTTNMSVPNSQGVASKLPRPVSAKNNSNIMHNSEASNSIH